TRRSREIPVVDTLELDQLHVTRIANVADVPDVHARAGRGDLVELVAVAGERDLMRSRFARAVVARADHAREPLRRRGIGDVVEDERCVARALQVAVDYDRL